MGILAIQLGHNSTAAYVGDDGEIKGILSEEKINNEKNSGCSPKGAVKYLIEENSCKGERLKGVTLCSKYIPIESVSNEHRAKQINKTEIDIKSIIKNMLKAFGGGSIYSKVIRARIGVKQSEVDRRIRELLKDLGMGIEEIDRIEHHECHRESVLRFFGEEVKRDSLVFTLDGEGDGICGSIGVYRSESNEISDVENMSVDNSIGWFYAGITEYLGMKKLEHEYKVMGLAAYPEPKYYSKLAHEFESLFSIVKKRRHWLIESRKDMTTMKRECARMCVGQRFDNIAAAGQLALENIVLEWVVKNIKESKCRSGLFSGGVFMNVKLNRRIVEESGLEFVRFMPSCGDESNVVALRKKDLPRMSMYQGHDLDVLGVADVNDLFPDTEYCVTELSDLDQYVAKLLFNGEIVGRACGKSEWGARSLGNRAVLGDPSRLESFYEINNRIKCRDFWMPFAPSILDTSMEKYLIGKSSCDVNNEHMMTAYASTNEARKDLKAALHSKDHTCRPQIVREKDNERYYKMIKEFERLSGIGAVLNTSLNIHGYPLASSLEQVAFTFRNSGLMHMAIGKYIYVRKR